MSYTPPTPLGYAEAAKEVQTIAAPLLTAAALSLAGVVAAASDNNFRWPGQTLLILVIASLLFIASIQLHFYARQYLYSPGDIEAWYGSDVSTRHRDFHTKRLEIQGDDFEKWRRFSNKATFCFNTGTLMLASGIALALIPQAGRQMNWRWAAVALIMVCTIADLIWIIFLYAESRRYRRKVRKKLSQATD